MKRFDYNDDDFHDDNLFPNTDDDDDDDDEEEGIIMDEAEYAELMRKQDELTILQLDLVQIDLNQRLLAKAVEIVKNNTWFFSFRSKTKQLKLIEQTYKFLKYLVSLPPEQSEI